MNGMNDVCELFCSMDLPRKQAVARQFDDAYFRHCAMKCGGPEKGLHYYLATLLPFFGTGPMNEAKRAYFVQVTGRENVTLEELSSIANLYSEKECRERIVQMLDGALENVRFAFCAVGLCLASENGSISSEVRGIVAEFLK